MSKCKHLGSPPIPPHSSAFVCPGRAVGSTSCVAVSIRRDTKKCHSFAPLLLPERKSYVQGLISTEGSERAGEAVRRRTRTDRTDADGMGDGISPWNVCSE